MQPTYAIAFISIGSTLLGTITGYFLSQRIAKTQAKYAETLSAVTAKRIAGAKLRAVFAPIISEFNRSAKKGAFDLQTPFFKNALVDQGAAIEEYLWFVPSERQRAYQQAWEDYHGQYGGVGWLDYVEDEGKKLFKQRIEAILKFTED